MTMEVKLTPSCNMDRSADLDFPLTGWRWRGVSDSVVEGLAYEQYPPCDFCDHQHLRYVHTLEHDLPPHRVLVGCVCAEDLTGDKANPKLEERKLRNLAARHRTLSTRREKIPLPPLDGGLWQRPLDYLPGRPRRGHPARQRGFLAQDRRSCGQDEVFNDGRG